MITQNAHREVTAHVGETQAFSIKANGKAFRALIDGLYENKIQSIVREIWSNALDSHVAAGCADKPFAVSFPSLYNPRFVVRDFGTSLSHEDVMHLYTTVFESTKEDTNAAVGKFGLGSKSPFAYTDTFSVTAFMDGTKRYYSAVIGEDGIPQIHFMGDEPTDEPNGIEVSFPIENRDINAFRRAAERVSHGFDVKPEVIKGTEDEEDFGGWPVLSMIAEGDGWKLLNGAIEGYQQRAYARMGCVLYPINVNAIEDLESHERELLGSTIVIEFPVGDLEINVSREALSYGSNEPTVDSIRNRVRTILSEMVQEFMDQYAACDTFYEACALFDTHMDTSKSQMPKPVREALRKTAEYKGRKLKRNFQIGNHEKMDVDLSKVGLDVFAITGEKLSNVNYRFDYYCDSIAVQPGDSTVIYIEDLTLAKKEKRVPARIRQHRYANEVQQVVWFKFRGGRGAHKALSQIKRLLKGAKFVNCADLDTVEKTDRNGYKRVPVQARVAHGSRFDQRIELDPEAFDEGGFFVPLDRMQPVYDHTCNSPMSVFNALQRCGAVPSDAILIGAPKSMWKKFEGDQWVNIYDFAKAWFDKNQPKKKIALAQAIEQVANNETLRFAKKNLRLEDLATDSPAVEAVEFYKRFVGQEKPAVQGIIGLAQVIGKGDLVAQWAKEHHVEMDYHVEALVEFYPLLTMFRDDLSWGVRDVLDKFTHYVQVCDTAREATNQAETAAVAA